jgi:hypothetical protein
MATKREDVEVLVKKTMEGRDIAASMPAEPSRYPYPAKRQIQVRFDCGDYEKLQAIAYRRGTKAAALVREAVKEVIRKDEVFPDRYG